MAVELREIKSDGSYGEILPDWSDLTFSQDLLSPGALTFKYPVGGRNASVLSHGAILTCLLDGIEPINGRFTFFEGEGTRLADADGQMASFGCTSNADRFNKLMLAPSLTSEYADENLFDFSGKTAGWLVQNAINNAMSRSINEFSTPPNWFNFPITSFDQAVDSSRQAWPAQYDAKFAPGTSVQGVIDWVVSNGFAEPQMNKNDFNLLHPANNGRDLTLGAKPIVLQTGADLIEATYQTTSKDLVTSLLVLGENNSCAWVYDADAIAQFGYREGTLQVSNASTKSTLVAAGQAYLSTRKIPRFSYTYSVGARYLEQTGGVPRPFVDYQVGDSVLVLDGVATAVQRVRLLSATWPSSRSATVNITVNDFFAERDAEFDRRMNRLGI